MIINYMFVNNEYIKEKIYVKCFMLFGRYFDYWMNGIIGNELEYF